MKPNERAAMAMARSALHQLSQWQRTGGLEPSPQLAQKAIEALYEAIAKLSSNPQKASS